MARRSKASKDQKALSTVVELINQQFGDGTIMRLGDRPHAKIDVVPTGSIGLDIAVGIGGYPKGRVVQIYGPESSGKTTLALHAVANAQKMGGIAAYIDAEQAFDATYARHLGVDISNLLLSQPDYGEQAFEIVEKLVRTGEVSVVVVDSVAALVPKAELEGTFEDTQVGLQARLMSKGLRMISGAVKKSNTLVIFINQTRMKIGNMYGPSETTPGGQALKFYSSVILDIRRIQTLKEGDTAVGNLVRVRVVKNKVAPPHRTAQFEIEYGRGISWEGEVLDLGVALKLVHKSGAWYSYKGEKLGQGRSKSKEFLRQHPEIAREIMDLIKKAYLKPDEEEEPEVPPPPPASEETAQPTGSEEDDFE